MQGTEVWSLVRELDSIFQKVWPKYLKNKQNNTYTLQTWGGEGCIMHLWVTASSVLWLCTASVFSQVVLSFSSCLLMREFLTFMSSTFTKVFYTICANVIYKPFPEIVRRKFSFIFLQKFWFYFFLLNSLIYLELDFVLGVKQINSWFSSGTE